MSGKKEFSSNTLKDALALAAADFNVDEQEVKYEIITEKTRYFGHKKREIYIRAWTAGGNENRKLEDFVKSMIAAMEMELDFEIQDKHRFLRVNFKGRDYRLMLYQNGNLLNAIQYVLNRLFSDSIEKKIYCECENFRRQREWELTQLAHRFAKEVKAGGKPVKIKELNPFERRIVHMTINKYNDLESVSDGDSFLKVITIRNK